MTHPVKCTLSAAAVAIATLGIAGGVPSAPAHAAGNPPRAAAARLAAQDVRATRLIGVDVRDPRGERLGDIADVVIDVDTGKVRYAILSFGGFMGLGDRLYAYPMRAFRLGSRSDELVLPVDRRVLGNAPGFESNRWPDWDGTYYETVDTFFGTDNETRYGRRLWRATDLIGENVRGRRGEDVGHVADLFVNLASSNVHYAVIEIDRLMRLADRRVAVPMQRLRVSRDSNSLVVDMTEDELARLPDVRGRQGALADERRR